jgi:HD-GYP domain-containing protein (c-di-GMP phosphodiesterase class II)
MMHEPAIPSQKSSRKPQEGLDPDLSKIGNSLIAKFYVLMRMSQIYDAKNVATHQFIQESAQIINTLKQKEGGLSLKIVGDDFFFNENRLRYSVENFTSFKHLLNQLKKRLIGEIIFKGVVEETDLRELIYGLVSLEEEGEENAASLMKHLAKKGISSIEVKPLDLVGEEEGISPHRTEDQQEVVKKIFFQAIGAIKEVVTQIKGNQSADVRKLKRLAQKTIQLVTEDESMLLGLTTIKNYDEYTYNHSVNVSIYSLAIGRRLGLSREDLTELGMTALLHDIGKSKIPIEVLNKPARLSEREWGMMKKHPLMGVEVVLNLKQLGEIHPRMVVGIFDHHLKNDLSGYPKLFKSKELNLFGKIIQIVDAYDAMTTPRIYKKVPYTMGQALAVMLKDRGTQFDPILLKVFISVVGVYPIGSLVLLDTHEMGIVCRTHPDSQFVDRPMVLLVGRDEKGGARKEMVDLTETDAGGHFKRSIVKTLDPYQYHIDIARYFM